jgi:predicted histone-like DNA-binding protein
MAIPVNVIQKRNPRDPLAPHKWYGVVKSVGKLSLTKFANRISRESTISSADVHAVLTAFLELIPIVLDDGFIVDLGEFGTFRAVVYTEGAETSDDFTIHNIKRANMRFTPGAQVKAAIRNFTYIKNETAEETPTP